MSERGPAGEPRDEGPRSARAAGGDRNASYPRGRGGIDRPPHDEAEASPGPRPETTPHRSPGRRELTADGEDCPGTTMIEMQVFQRLERAVSLIARHPAYPGKD